ncbi:MAG: bifunctional phosphopantothenoylcysteine decarboxylase/phosphopantothenate--cysteine ligase CoaBC [Cyanobacteria bacterium P01_F01_bin.150]
MVLGDSVHGKHILIGISGGVAAYKVCEVVSTLAKAGADVQVIVTNEAQRFVSPLTFAALSRHPVYTDQDFWSAQHPRPLHISLGEWADVFLLAPLTAHSLAQLAYGLADNLMMNTVLASTCPLLLAPAMNTDMWQQETVQHNWQQVQSLRRCHTVGPRQGRLACDRVGTGRMAEPSQLITHLQSLLQTHGNSDLIGQTILVSGGSTREHLDTVRFIGNPSTGKMGIALALAAHHRGAEVIFVHGPIDKALLADLSGLEKLRSISVLSASEMHKAMLQEFSDASWTLMAAAVADVKPTDYHPKKLPKAKLPDAIALSLVPDIIADLGKQKQPHQKLVGFAAQTDDIVPPARSKLTRKKLDAIVANPIDHAGSGFGSDQNQGVFLDCHDRQRPIPLCTKLELAHYLLDFIKEMDATVND